MSAKDKPMNTTIAHASAPTGTQPNNLASPATQQHRRLHLWWKHTLGNVATSALTQPSFHPNQEAYNNMPEIPLCRNIDEALHSFRVEDDSPIAIATSLPPQESSSTISCVEYDWLLDGIKDHEYHSRRSMELLQELKVPDIEEMVIIRDVTWGPREQELQFASFPQENDDDEENFGDFQTADVIDDQSGNSDKHEKNGNASLDSANTKASQEEKKDDLENPDHKNDELEGGVSTKDHTDFVQQADEMAGANVGQLEEGVMSEGDTDDDVSIPLEVKFTSADSDYSTDVLSCSSHEIEGAIDADEWDLTTLEGRFLRRQIPEPKPEPLSLPQHFLVENNPTSLCEAMVRSLPWKHVPFLQKDFASTLNCDEDMALVEDHLMSQLMQLDGWLAAVSTQSLQQVWYRKHSLELCNQHLRELNHSLAMANLYAHQSKVSLAKARGDEFSGLTSEMILLDAWDQRDIYSELDSLLVRCLNLFEQERELTQKFKAFAEDTSLLEDIVEAARLFSSSAHDDPLLSRLIALDDLRERAFHILGSFSGEIKVMVQNLVTASCASWKRFCPTKFGDFFRAMLRIHRDEDVKNIIPEIWCKCIVDALMFEAEKSLSVALLDPTCGGDSAHDKELLSLEYALRDAQGDHRKLKTVCHNLLTIRFEFEISFNYFPMVIHRLCLKLTDVLYSHHIMMSWHLSHPDLDPGVSKLICQQLEESKLKLWKECEIVLGTCMEEYLKFSSKKKLFGEDSDKFAWINDLDAMHDVMQLTHQFCKIGREFLGDKLEHEVPSLPDESCESSLRSKLCAVHRKHLRSVHVESMNSLGFMLSRESWQLVPLHPVANGLTGFCSSEKEFMAYIAKLVAESMTVAKGSLTREVKLWENGVRASKYAWFTRFPEAGNPFEVQRPKKKKNKHSFIDCQDSQRIGLERAHEREIDACTRRGVYDMLVTMVENNFTDESRIAIETCFKGFMKCLARIMLVMEKLPLIVCDTTKVVENLTDLFLSTVFRLCCGNAMNENLILGGESPKRYLTETSNGKRKNATPLIGFGRRSSERPTRPPQPITARLEAEICSPLYKDKMDVALVRSFLRRAQSSLDGVVKLDMVQGWIVDPSGISPDESDEEYLCKVCTCFEKRQSAAWSCVFIASLLDLLKHFALETLTKNSLAAMLGDDPKGLPNTALNGVTSLVDYINSVLVVVPLKVQLSMKMASARAIGSRRIVEEICRTDWDTSRLSESSHRYVDLVLGRYCFIWRFLSTSAKLPMGIRRCTWEILVEAGFSTFLEGFARVPNCSTEGRSSMSIDLAAFSAGLMPSSIGQKMEDDSIPLPPSTASQTRRQYVDTYIKVSYMPQQDAMKWIEDNFAFYHLNHCVALIGGRADSIESVEQLYRGCEAKLVE